MINPSHVSSWVSLGHLQRCVCHCTRRLWWNSYVDKAAAVVQTCSSFISQTSGPMGLVMFGLWRRSSQHIWRMHCITFHSQSFLDDFSSVSQWHMSWWFGVFEYRSDQCVVLCCVVESVMWSVSSGLSGIWVWRWRFPDVFWNRSFSFWDFRDSIQYQWWETPTRYTTSLPLNYHPMKKWSAGVLFISVLEAITFRIIILYIQTHFLLFQKILPENKTN